MWLARLYVLQQIVSASWMLLVCKTGLENAVVFNVNFTCFLFLLPVTSLLPFYPTSVPDHSSHIALVMLNQLETSKWDSIFSGSEVEPETHFYIFFCACTCMRACVGQKTPCGCQLFLIPHGAWGSNLGCQVRAWCWSRGQQQDRGCVLVLWFSHYCQCFIFLIFIVCKLIIQRNNWVLYKVLWPQNAAQRGFEHTCECTLRHKHTSY